MREVYTIITSNFPQKGMVMIEAVEYFLLPRPWRISYTKCISSRELKLNKGKAKFYVEYIKRMCLRELSYAVGKWEEEGRPTTAP